MPYHKYRNTPTTVDNIKFASAAESRRYTELKFLLDASFIKDLKLQPRFELLPKYVNGAGDKIQKMEYVADFSYFDIERNCFIVEDVKRKATATAVYKLKKKWFEQKYYPLTIMEVDA